MGSRGKTLAKALAKRFEKRFQWNLEVDSAYYQFDNGHEMLRSKWLKLLCLFLVMKEIDIRCMTKNHQSGYCWMKMPLKYSSQLNK